MINYIVTLFLCHLGIIQNPKNSSSSISINLDIFATTYHDKIVMAMYFYVLVTSPCGKLLISGRVWTHTL